MLTCTITRPYMATPTTLALQYVTAAVGVLHTCCSMLANALSRMCDHGFCLRMLDVLVIDHHLLDLADISKCK